MAGPEDEWTAMVMNSAPAVRPAPPVRVVVEPAPEPEPPPPMERLLEVIEELKAGRLPQGEFEKLLVTKMEANAARAETERLIEESRPSRFDRLDD